jgi:ParB family chromosome partitioning protein
VTRRGLGRGLDALLASTEGPAAAVDHVPTVAIRPNPYQPRREVDEAALAELAESVRRHGLLQPLVVARADDGYVLIAGERRWRAAQRVGLAQVPVVVREADAQEMLALAIVENVQRADLDPLEAASAYRRLTDEFGLTQTEVAELVGKSRAAVANTVRLLGLSADVRGLVATGRLSEGHGRALLAVADAGDQRSLAERALAGGWTVRRLEAEVREGRASGAGAARPSPPRVGPGEPSDPDTRAAEGRLQEALGTRVEIRRRHLGEGGTLVIHFYSEEELAALFERIAGGS